MNDPGFTAEAAALPVAVLHFAADGTGAGLYTEAIDLQALGRLEVTRATWIQFEEGAQKGVVYDYLGLAMFSHASRQVCLEWEHRHFNDDAQASEPRHGKEVAA